MEVWTVLSIVIAIVVAWIVKSVFLKQETALDRAYKQFPVVKEAPFLGSIVELGKQGDKNNPNDPTTGFLHFARKHGRAFSVNIVGLKTVILTDPQDSRELNANLQDFERDVFFSRDEDIMGRVLFAIDGNDWKIRRKRLNHFFAPTHLRHYAPHLQEAVREFCDACVEKRDTAVDLDDYFIRMTLNVIVRFTMGVDPDAFNSDKFGFMTTFKLMGFALFIWGNLPAFVWEVLCLPWRVQLYMKTSYMRRAVGQIIDQRVSAENQGEDLTGGVAKALKNGEISREDSISELIGIVFAGHDTTAHSMCWTLYYLATKPEVLKKVQEEVDALIPASEDGGWAVADAENVRKMEWVRACFNESLRLHPPALLHPVTAKHDTTITIGGKTYDVPKGMVFSGSQMIYQRLEKHWGEDAQEWNPSRHIGKDTSQAFTPFLTGPHYCLGVNLANLEALITLSSVVRNLDLRVDETSRVQSVAEFTLRPKGVKLFFSRRQ